MELLLILLAAYLIGSIPFGLILGRLAGIGDIRKTGSGNIGATNMLRAGGKWLGLMTLLLDMAKGIAVFILIKPYVGTMETYSMGAVFMVVLVLIPLAGMLVVIGHIFPVWLKFKGGKGVATNIGVYLGIPIVTATPADILPAAFTYGAIPIAIWVGVFLVTRYSSVAGMASALLPPLILLCINIDAFMYFIPHFLVGLLITFKHRDNIRRLRRGEEPKVSFGGKE